jgi:uncharacterized protein YjlB
MVLQYLYEAKTIQHDPRHGGIESFAAERRNETSSRKPQLIHLSRNGWMPNNERLPVLLCRNVITVESSDPAAIFEAQFQRHGWPPQWRNGVYDFHHYHSTAYEVLGFAGGHATLI